jgi:hypothetical protein
MFCFWVLLFFKDLARETGRVDLRAAGWPSVGFGVVPMVHSSRVASQHKLNVARCEGSVLDSI